MIVRQLRSDSALRIHGLACIVTHSSFTVDEDFSLASPESSPSLVMTVNLPPFGRSAVSVSAMWSTSTRCESSLDTKAAGEHSRIIVESASSIAGRRSTDLIGLPRLHNEQYFCGLLDAVAGDEDFGASLARGFESVLRTGIHRPVRYKADFTRCRDAVPGSAERPADPWGTVSGTCRHRDRIRTNSNSATCLAMIEAAIAEVEHRGGNQ